MKEKVNIWLEGDIEFSLTNFSPMLEQWFKMSESDRREFRNLKMDPWTQMAQAIRILVNIGFGDIFPIPQFIKEVEDGFFIDDDGSGAWVDADGNHLGNICCDADWLRKNQPENAVFIMWYNK